MSVDVLAPRAAHVLLKFSIASADSKGSTKFDSDHKDRTSSHFGQLWSYAWLKGSGAATT